MWSLSIIVQANREQVEVIYSATSEVETQMRKVTELRNALNTSGAEVYSIALKRVNDEASNTDK